MFSFIPYKVSYQVLIKYSAGIPALLFSMLLFMGGCSVMNPVNFSDAEKTGHPPGTILSAASGKPVSFGDMISDLLTARVIYVGETHTRAEDHEIQLEILKAVFRHRPELAVGMEMFARPYQKVLDDWSNQVLAETEFIQKTHWYANWKYDFGLYAGLLNYIREHKIPLFALNISFHIPSKIAAGGIESLLAHDREQLPESIFLEDDEHRQYVLSVFEKHGKIRNHYSFEHFYQAQCVWEDAMAESISRQVGKSPMMIFTGNGHIINKFGIPDRAFARFKAPFRTIMPVSIYSADDLQAADYLWITGRKAEES